MLKFYHVVLNVLEKQQKTNALESCVRKTAKS